LGKGGGQGAWWGCFSEATLRIEEACGLAGRFRERKVYSKKWVGGKEECRGKSANVCLVEAHGASVSRAGGGKRPGKVLTLLNKG